jgi:outer membrane lipoprotein-sorting protein
MGGSGKRIPMKATLLLLALLTPPAPGRDIRDGADVLRAMHDRYPAWYQTITFTQKSTTYKPDGTNTAETWYEASSIPGKLRIDIGPASAGNGYVLVDGKVSTIKDNQVVATRDRVNMLLVLGFDVYRQDPETTIKVVKGEGYDLSKLREDAWEGKPVYVVGADPGDLKSRQFWVDKETLLFVREIAPQRDDPGKLNDIRFTHYEPLEGGWVATGVEVYSDGKKVFSEDYTDVRANVRLDPAVFDPQQFRTTHWEKEVGAVR